MHCLGTSSGPGAESCVRGSCEVCFAMCLRIRVQDLVFLEIPVLIRAAHVRERPEVSVRPFFTGAFVAPQAPLASGVQISRCSHYTKRGI